MMVSTREEEVRYTGSNGDALRGGGTERLRSSEESEHLTMNMM